MNHTYTTAQLRFIKDNLHMTDRELANIIGVTKTKIHAFRRRHKLIKSQYQFSLIGANYGRGRKAA